MIATNQVSTPHVLAALPAEARLTSQLKKLVWLYIVLLFFEGALRKWFLPSLATPLLVIRDPLVILILCQAAFSRTYRILNPYTLVAFLVTIIGILLTLGIGHQNLYVALFGARITALHFALIFVIGQVFDRNDVLRVGRFIMWLTPPMALLIGLQFYSPQSAWINQGIGGNIEGAGFSGALGYFRPPGTFSFTIGNTLFFDLAATFVAYFWIGRKDEIPRLLLIAATVGILAAIPLSLSRGYVFQFGITVLFLVIASLRNWHSFGRIIIAIIFIPFILVTLQQFEFFNTSIEALIGRFNLASLSEGGVEGTLLDRFLGGNIGALSNYDRTGLWGQGLGIGTNVGAFLISGSITFLVGENEWERIIGELGLFLGLAAILIRVFLATHLGYRSILKVLQGDPLPWMLLSFGLVQIVYGQWASPTVHGFGVLIASLLVSALNTPKYTH